MKMTIESEGLEVDAWLVDDASSTVCFAVWYDRPRLERIAVELGCRVDAAGFAMVRCTLRAETVDGRSIEAEGWGPNACEAIQEASTDLEAALRRMPTESYEGLRSLIAA